MRRLVLVTVLSLTSLTLATAAQRPLPPPPAPPQPAVAPTTVPPRTIVPESVVAAPIARTPARVVPPEVVFAPTQAPPPSGQTPRPGAKPTPAGAAALIDAQLQNVKLDVTISDSLSADTQNRKVVSMLILNGRSGQIRSAGGSGLINIDANVNVRNDGRIIVQLTMEYQPELSPQQTQQAGLTRGVTMFSESLALIVPDGTPVMASQSADPRSDRRVAVEVTATVTK